MDRCTESYTVYILLHFDDFVDFAHIIQVLFTGIEGT